MAQTIKLKRSSTSGKVPTTSQLALGEIAINTHDGRIFFEKNDGSATVEHILTTDSITTGSVYVTGSIQADNLLFDGATISSDLELVIDSSADIVLDADGADILLKDNGTAFGRFNRTSSDFIIKSETSDKDIIFKGVDNSSTISALTLDMSAAGAATFHGGIADAGTIAAGTWNGSAISTTYLSNTSGTNTGDETQATINALDITEVGTISSGVWNGTAIASAYLDSDTAHLSGTQTFSGAKTFSNSTSSTSKTTGAVIVTGGVGISGALNVGGDVTAFASSDERYKDLITPIQNPNEKIKLLSGNTFVWNDKHEIFKGKKDIGVIAQEVEKVLPEIVETRDNGYKAVKYEKIVALLIESNKELLKRVEDLEANLSAEKGRD